MHINNSRSFLTRDRPDDSNATPPKTTSFFWPGITGGGWLIWGTKMPLSELASTIAAAALGVDAMTEPVFTPGRTYLFGG